MIGRFALAATAAALACACVADSGEVLVQGPVLVACEEAALRVSDRQACAFVSGCAIPSRDEPRCCTDIVTCADGALTVQQYCAASCATCGADRECEPGRSLCDGDVCVACPDPATCMGCAPGVTPIVRNGCTTCECGPPSECELDAPACGPMGVLTCYPGQRCGAGCRPDEPGCCLNVCSPPGCSSPAPLGCDTPCPPNAGCMSCQTSACRCDGMTWSCDAVCADRTDACFFAG